MAKTENAVAVIESNEFAAVAVIGGDPTALTELIRENVGTDLTPFDLPRIVVPAGGGSFWEVPTAAGPKPAEFIDGIILLRKDKKKFWEKGKDESGGEVTPPDCSSDDRITGHGNPGGSCADCPYNEFKSAKKGDGKACRDFAELYILKKDSLMPTVIQVPATSLKNLKQFGMVLIDSVKNMSAVVTRFSLTSEMKSGAKTAIVTFKAVGDVPADMVPFVKEYQKTVRALLDRPVAAQEPAASSDTMPENDGPAPFEA